VSDLSRARLEGEETADQVVRAQAGAGMSAERIDASAEEVLAARFEGRPDPESDAFWSGYDTTEAIYAADLRDLEREDDATRYARGAGPQPPVYLTPRESVRSPRPGRSGMELEAGA